jgi:hypothetical protein
MNSIKFTLLTALLLAPMAALHAADDKPDLSRWKDDFSDSVAFAKNWSSYGFLAAGIDAKNPLGKPVGGKDSRPEWWQIVDGALRGQNFPEEKHGFRHLARCIRSGRAVKLPVQDSRRWHGRHRHSRAESDLEKVFNVVSLHIRTDSIVAADNDVIASQGFAGGGGVEEEGHVESQVLLRKDGEDRDRARGMARSRRGSARAKN